MSVAFLASIASFVTTTAATIALVSAVPRAASAQSAATPPPAPIAAAAQASPANDELWDAARVGDVARVTRALEKGADVNAKTRYGATALTFASDKGHLDVVKLLLARGADVNVQDSFYKMRAIDMALSNSHSAVAALLLQHGSQGAGFALQTGARTGDEALVKAALEAKDLTPTNVESALVIAKKGTNTAVTELLTAKLASMPKSATPTVTVDRATLQTYVGSYRNEPSGMVMTIALNGDQLTSGLMGQSATLVPTSPTNFRFLEVDGMTIEFAGRGGLIERALVSRNNNTQTWDRVTTPPASTAGTPTGAAPSTTAPSAAPSTGSAAKPAAPAGATRAVTRAAGRPWPAFRGENAAGNGDGQGAVTEWDVDTGQHILWKTPIPGISNASPIAWGNRIFVVSATSSAGDKTFRTGLYGDVAPVSDLSEHTWKIYGLDRGTGKVIWEQTVFTGLPKVKRHTKASQANSSPVTDGKTVVAAFGSIGVLAAWDVNGKPLWKTNIGVLDSGWFFDPEYQWGHSSSPIIYKQTVILQADQQKGSYLAAYDLASGKEVWRTQRDEISTWGTPTIFRAGGREQLVTNGPKIRGYDPATGKLLWTLGPNSEITVGTPVVGDGLIYVTGGYPPARPIYAIKPTAAGDITLAKDQATHEALAWSNDREGTYIPTPIFYEGILYTCNSNGILTAYDGKSGERLYRARVGGGGSFSASPIAADGKLYFANEDGDVFVIQAGRTYQEVAKNEMKEVVMGTPAITDGVIIVRTLGHVYGIGQK